MIPQIKELNFPSYATISQATITLNDMGDRTISTQIKIDGNVIPDFSYDWEVEFQGEKYIHAIREPQAGKSNESICSLIDLTFQHWTIYQLRRYYFVETASTNSGTAIVDKYIASLGVNLKTFCDAFQSVLDHYFDGNINIDLNPERQYDEEPSFVEISYTHIWDVLQKVYDIYGVRWTIEGNTIKVGYPTKEISHIFEYGFDGGLLKIERQVQNTDIRNSLLGRGGSKNLPFRYFKDTDKNNPTFSADPDWIPELANIYFSELRGKTFRDYVKGWKAKHYGGIPMSQPTEAYFKGFNDSKFNPIEFVEDKESIAKYGLLQGALDNQEEIYPTIQGTGHDVAIAVEQIKSDEIEETTEAEAEIANAPEVSGYVDVYGLKREKIELISKPFTVKKGMTANLMLNSASIKYGAWWLGLVIVGEGADMTIKKQLKPPKLLTEDTTGLILVENADYTVVDKDNNRISPIGITEGEYHYIVSAEVYNPIPNSRYRIQVSYAPILESAKLTDPKWLNTFSVWVDNIWNSQKKSNETPEEYSRRIWQPILGDKEETKPAVMFTTGDLSISEDYEFLIVDYPTFDDSKSFDGVTSHWRLLLAKSDADFESSGFYIPSTHRQGKAGDKFAFLGIDMPHDYVLWAEERLDTFKQDQLLKTSNIKPTWVVQLDKVRLNTASQHEAKPLLNSLSVGNSIRLRDSRFIKGEETLYLQTITYTWQPNTSVLPDVEVVLSDKVATSLNPVAQLQGEVDVLTKQVGSISNIQQIVRSVGDKLYLRKDGIADKSLSPTEFSSLLTVGKFHRGLIGGSGVGIYKDANGSWVIEADRLNVRQDMQVNNLVVNQAEARGGMMIDTAAYLEISNVVENADSYTCYFNTHSGTIANLFKVDDIAYCQRWSTDSQTLKYYKRRVLAIDVDSVTLSKSEVNGIGNPEIGDVIIHYGNYTDHERQYVKVRDVIGGGYERYIEGLNSVNAQGKEFFFVGREMGSISYDIVAENEEEIIAENDEQLTTESKAIPQNTRWFVGDADGANIEYKNGELALNKVKLSVNSRIGDETITDFVSKQKPNENLVVQSDKQIDVTQAILDEYSWVEKKLQLVEPLIPNEEYTFSVQSENANGDIAISIEISDKEIQQYNVKRIDEQLNVKYVTFTSPIATSEINLEVFEVDTIYRVKLEKGNKPTAWNRANYLERALLESTTIDGGLVATSLIQLGYTIDEDFVVQSGVSGIANPNRIGNGVAFWAGGDMVDAEETEEGTPAKFLIRHDGTGYMSQMKFGKNLRLAEDELIMVTDKNGKSFTIKAGATGYADLEDAKTPEQTFTINKSVKAKQLIISSGGNYWATPQFNEIIQEINDALKGSNVKLNIALEWKYPTIAGSSPTAWGYVTAELLQNGEVIAQFINSETNDNKFAWKNGSSSTINGTQYAVFYCSGVGEIELPNGGDYEIRIATHTNTTISPERTDDVSLSQKVTTLVSALGVYQTIIGADGFASNWGNALVAVSEQGAIMRFGKTWFKVDNDGIKYTINGTTIKNLT